MKKVQRYFLELNKGDKTSKNFPSTKNFKIVLINKKDFEINKFFYKQIGSEHYWRDRLVWPDKEWIEYVKDDNLQTWIIKKNNDLVGFYENKFHPDKKEFELINMGILKEFRGLKLGSILLNHVIEQSFKSNAKRIWVHTCSLDHKYALKNYEARGFKIFKQEEINFVA